MPASQPDDGRRRAGEGHDEAQEIQRQGDDPEQRHRREVGGQVRRHAHQPARNGTKTRTSQPSAVRRLRRGVGLSPAFDRPRRPPMGCLDSIRLQMQARSHTSADRQHDETRPPEPGLGGQAQLRLDDERIGQERDQAAGVARGIEEVRIVSPGMSGQLNQRWTRGAVAATTRSGSVAERPGLPSKSTAGSRARDPPSRRIGVRSEAWHTP